MDVQSGARVEQRRLWSRIVASCGIGAMAMGSYLVATSEIAAADIPGVEVDGRCGPEGTTNNFMDLTNNRQNQGVEVVITGHDDETNQDTFIDDVVLAQGNGQMATIDIDKDFESATAEELGHPETATTIDYEQLCAPPATTTTTQETTTTTSTPTTSTSTSTTSTTSTSTTLPPATTTTTSTTEAPATTTTLPSQSTSTTTRLVAAGEQLRSSDTLPETGTSSTDLGMLGGGLIVGGLIAIAGSNRLAPKAQ
jgi:LPXTG-motif cell wall-anchored protein